MSRIWVAVDVHQLWTAAQYEYGSGNKIDFSVLMGELNKVKIQGDQITANAYLLDKAFHKDEKFIRVLTKIGFVPVEVPSYTHQRQTKTTSSTKMTIDALNAILNFDKFIIVSGNGDLIPLVRHLRNCGKTVEIWSFREDAAGDLFKSATGVHFLNKEHLYVHATNNQSEN